MIYRPTSKGDTMELTERPNYRRIVELASDLYEAIRYELDAVGITEFQDDDHNSSLVEAFNNIDYIIGDLRYWKP